MKNTSKPSKRLRTNTTCQSTEPSISVSRIICQRFKRVNVSFGSELKKDGRMYFNFRDIRLTHPDSDAVQDLLIEVKQVERP